MTWMNALNLTHEIVMRADAAGKSLQLRETNWPYFDQVAKDEPVWPCASQRMYNVRA